MRAWGAIVTGWRISELRPQPEEKGPIIMRWKFARVFMSGDDDDDDNSLLAIDLQVLQSKVAARSVSCESL